MPRERGHELREARAWHALSAAEVLAHLHVEAEGLREAEALRRIMRVTAAVWRGGRWTSSSRTTTSRRLSREWWLLLLPVALSIILVMELYKWGRTRRWAR